LSLAVARSIVRGLIALLALIASVTTYAADTPTPHPRENEAVRFTTHWLDLLDEGKADESFDLLTPIFQSNLTRPSWRESVMDSKAKLGKLLSRRLRRVVWYENPANAPLPGTYVAVEFDSDYERTQQHFQYVMLHSQRGEPFKVMRHETTMLMQGAKTERIL
jgi:hypothetical protein